WIVRPISATHEAGRDGFHSVPDFPPCVLRRKDQGRGWNASLPVHGPNAGPILEVEATHERRSRACELRGPLTVPVRSTCNGRDSPARGSPAMLDPGQSAVRPLRFIVTKEWRLLGKHEPSLHEPT